MTTRGCSRWPMPASRRRATAKRRRRCLECERALASPDDSQGEETGEAIALSAKNCIVDVVDLPKRSICFAAFSSLSRERRTTVIATEVAGHAEAASTVCHLYR